MSNYILDNRPLQIILDGRIFEEQPFGGISRIYHEILPRICQMDEQIVFFISTFGRLRQPLPAHPQIMQYHSRFSAHRFLRPQTIFWQLQDYMRSRLQDAFIPFNKKSVWHATYFQLPVRLQGSKVVSVYDLIYEKYPQFFDQGYDDILRKRKKRAILAADRVICISETVRSEVMEMYALPPERAIVIPLACGDNFRQMSSEEIPAGSRIDRPFILYVGIRNHYKNFKTLFDAYAVWSRRNQIALLVVGNAWSEDEWKEIHAAGLESNVICRSGISDEELCALYNQALAFVYPSLVEGFGIPLLEAMACGCRIVASRIPVFEEVARDVPYFFEPLDKEELLAALEAACFGKETFGHAEAILANYSWDRNARTTLKLYKELALCT